MRKLTLEGKITIFKSLAISKIVHLEIITKVSHDYKDSGLKNVDIEHKIASLKCSWVKQLFTENFHEWKIIPLQHINKLSGKNFKFHSKLNISKNTLYFPGFYKDILKL